MPKSVPVAALSPAPAAAPLAPAPALTTPPASVLKPPAPIPPRVGRDMKNEGNVEMPGRTRGETRAMRDALQEYAHRHGVLSTVEHAALVSMPATRESTNEIVRQHSAPKDSPDLPTAHIPDISKPSRVSDVEESPHVDWRHPTNASGVVPWVFLSIFVLPTQTTPVKQPTGGLYQAVQLCVEVHVCVDFLGRRNVSPSLLLKQSMLPLATQ